MQPEPEGPVDPEPDGGDEDPVADVARHLPGREGPGPQVATGNRSTVVAGRRGHHFVNFLSRVKASRNIFHSVWSSSRLFFSFWQLRPENSSLLQF